jgi:superfamily II DNA/RNA helicase
MRDKYNRLKAVIIVPTSNLSRQVYEVVKMFQSKTKITCALLNGGISYKEEADLLIGREEKNEEVTYINKCQIIITTPGKISEHFLKTKGKKLY